MVAKKIREHGAYNGNNHTDEKEENDHPAKKPMLFALAKFPLSFWVKIHRNVYFDGMLLILNVHTCIVSASPQSYT